MSSLTFYELFASNGIRTIGFVFHLLYWMNINSNELSDDQSEEKKMTFIFVTRMSYELSFFCQHLSRG